MIETGIRIRQLTVDTWNDFTSLMKSDAQCTSGRLASGCVLTFSALRCFCFQEASAARRENLRLETELTVQRVRPLPSFLPFQRGGNDTKMSVQRCVLAGSTAERTRARTGTHGDRAGACAHGSSSSCSS